MAKRKSHRRKPGAPARSGRALQRKLAQAEDLLMDGKLTEAAALLQDLARRHPNSFEVQWQLLGAYQAMNDRQAMLGPAIHLVELRPQDPDLLLNLAGVYMTNTLMALALQAFQEFLARWPDHAEAASVRRDVARLRASLSEATAKEGITLEGNEDLILMHEQVQVCLNTHRLDEGRRLVDEILARWPTFAPALNNLSLSYFVQGRVDEAIAASRRVLDECDPGNYHALSNLIHYLVMAGRVDEARSLAEQLKAAQSERVDVWAKKAEGLSYLGDDEGVNEVFGQAGAAGLLDAPFADPLLFHLAAVASARLGDEREARQRWRQALEISPGFQLAQENLADRSRPTEERQGAWPFPLGHWLPKNTLEELVKALKPAARRSHPDDEAGERAVERATRRFLEQHSEFEELIPLLLARGDPQGREFAHRIARMAETPSALAALRDFGLGQDGPDQMRLDAAQAAAQAGLLPRGKPVRLWLQGEWHDGILLLGWTISPEPKGRLPGRAQRLMEQAIPAIHEGRLDEAEELLEQARGLMPDDPSILQNLSAIYSRRGDHERAMALTREIVERNPDYVIGRCNLALFAAHEGNVKEARRWLEPVLQVEELHTSEFSILCRAQVELLLAEGQHEGAQSWIQMWEEVDPDDPMLPLARLRVGRASRLVRSVLGRGRRGKRR